VLQVPSENLVGKEGQAALCMMRNLEIERVGLAAMSLGIARRYVDGGNRGAAGVGPSRQRGIRNVIRRMGDALFDAIPPPLTLTLTCVRCVEVMNRYAQERKAFGKPIGDFGQVQRHIAESYAKYMAGERETKPQSALGRLVWPRGSTSFRGWRARSLFPKDRFSYRSAR
jgi:isovaleryl-CoA dehydrogenase